MSITFAAPFTGRRVKTGRWLSGVLLLLFLGGCAQTQLAVYGVKRLGKAVESVPDRDKPGPVGRYKVGTPYRIDGIWYYPNVDYSYRETGIASWYGPKFDGRRTANGEIFDQYRVSAAHKTLPLPSMVRVTNLENGRSLTLRVNDRGPFAKGRIIDLSRRAAQLLGFERQGTARVVVEILPEESRRLARLAGAGNDGVADAPVRRPSPRPPIAVVSTSDAAPAPPPQPVRRATPVTLSPPKGGAMEIGPARQTAIFIQAGAFSIYDNALRLRNRLIDFGPTEITPIEVSGATLYRVRVGPLQTVAEADVLLDRVVAAGHSEARVTVVCGSDPC